MQVSSLNHIESFDIVLVLEYFRPVTHYLSIIKALNERFRIGICVIPIPERERFKNGASQERFEALCISMGATRLRLGDSIKTRLLILPQRPYSDEAVQIINEKIECIRKVGLMGFAWAGIPVHDAFIKKFDLKTVLVIDKSFIEYLLLKRAAQETYSSIDIIEVGLPYAKYPIYSDFSVDYILAMPTPFSFQYEEDKWYFLENVWSIFEKINKKASIVHKPHNGQERDYFSPRWIRGFARFSRRIPYFLPLIRCFTRKFSSPRLSGGLGKLYTALLYEKVLSRTVSLDKYNINKELALESLLPHVKCGVLGGLSNTIWGSLFFEVPFYNCLSFEKRNRYGPPYLYGKKIPDPYFDLNMNYFVIPSCDGEICFNEKHFSIVSDSNRSADLISVVCDLAGGGNDS